MSEAPTRTRALSSYLRWILRGHVRPALLVAGLSVVAALCEAALLALVAATVSAIASPTRLFELHSRWLGDISLGVPTLLGIGVGAVLGRALMQILVGTVDSRTVARWEAERRRRLVEGFLAASWDLQAGERAGRLQTLMTENLGQAGRSLHSFAGGIVAVANFAILLLAALTISLVPGLIMLAVALALFAITRPISSWARTHTNARARHNVAFAAAVNETVELAREARVFNVSQPFAVQVARWIERIRHERVLVAFAAVLLPAVYQNLAGLAILGGLALVYSVGSAALAAQAAVAFMLIRALTYAQSLQNVYHHIVEALPYIDQLEDTEAEFARARPSDGTTTVARIDRMSFEDVSYSYEPGRRPAVAKVSFAVERGEAIGIVGPSGSGKSTLVQLLLRLREPQSGQIRVNGTLLTEYTRASWFDRVSYVPQEPRLLVDTVEANIRFHRDGVSRDDVERAARLAGLHDEIVARPDGYATPVGPRGEGFSGGQRQRLCIARALLRQPEVIIFDEPTSALDVHAEAVVSEALARLKGSATLFIIAHRLSTLRVCDRVMVLQEGRLQSFSSSEELARDEGYFAEALRLAQL